MGMLCFSITVSAQKIIIKRDSLMSRARLMVKKGDQSYNPDSAFVIYKQKALEGNAEAMNALGLLYSRGEGVSIDEKEGIKWVRVSALKGYGKAWYNLGMMYKNGIGTEQNFEKAFGCFSKGVAQKEAFSYYGQGYMYFKGFGCEQDYGKAFTSFITGAKKWPLNPNTMYFLGICYRNGYGTECNLDSARYWLDKAAKYKQKWAVEEIGSTTAENVEIKEIPKLQGLSSSQDDIIEIQKGYRKVAHYLPSDRAKGEYTGYAIKFDWSGKHIIATSELKVKLKVKKGEFEAEWQEGNEVPVNLMGTVTDSSIMFKDIIYQSFDHYHQKEANQLRLEEAVLQMTKNGEHSIIAGNIKRYSLTHKEPEKPMFIMLINSRRNQFLPVNNEQETDSVNFRQYPNPFIHSFDVSYSLKEKSQVSIILSNVQNGNIVYRSNVQMKEAGEHTQKVAVNVPPGYYVVTLNYGNKLKSAIIYKQ